MIRVHNLPLNAWVAVSGGVDSMAVLDFLTNGKSRIDGAIYINHGTDFSNEAEKLVEEFCEKKSIKLDKHKIAADSEARWRFQRRWIYGKYSSVITAHHLDDVAEWWIMTSLRGQPRLIPWVSGNVHHPFLASRKEAFREWAKQKEVPFLDDPTNVGNYNDRAKIRAIMPALLDVYPGIHQTLFGKLHAVLSE